MHTKHRNIERLNQLAKHWAFNINPDSTACVKFFMEKCNYENLLTEEEVKQGIEHIYSLAPKTRYGNQELFPAFIVHVSLQSGKSNNLSVYIQAATMEEFTSLINEFKQTYKESIFKVERIYTYKQMENNGCIHHLSMEEENQVFALFNDILNYESKAYKDEEIKMQWIHFTDFAVCELVENDSLVVNFVQIGFAVYLGLALHFIAIDNYKVAGYIGAFLLFSAFFNRNKIFVNKRKKLTEILQGLNKYYR